jgi:ribonuclease Z
MVLLDCGEGTQVQMRRFHWGFRRLDAICLSHLHADHVGGLPGLFHTVAHAGRTEPMQIYGPPGTVRAVEGLRVIAPHLPYDVKIHELQPGDTFALPNGLRARTAGGEHRLPCLAYRFDLARQPAFDTSRAEALGVPMQAWSRLQDGDAVDVDGRTVHPADVLGEPRLGIDLGFVTDTRPTAAIRALMQEVDLLVAESTYQSDEEAGKAIENGHMTVREACDLARSVDARELWLTHFSATIENPEELLPLAQSVFPRVVIGHAGLSTTLAYPEP